MKNVFLLPIGILVGFVLSVTFLSNAHHSVVDKMKLEIEHLKYEQEVEPEYYIYMSRHFKDGSLLSRRVTHSEFSEMFGQTEEMLKIKESLCGVNTNGQF